MPAGTYAGHENGHRGFPARRAAQYARRFKISEEWLLYGKGSIDDEPDERMAIPSIDQLEEMIRIALLEVQPGARLADYPPIVASSLRAQLERLQVHGAVLAEPKNRGVEETPHGKGAQSRAPTMRGVRAR